MSICVAMENNDSPVGGIRRYVTLLAKGKFAIVATILHACVAQKLKNSTEKTNHRIEF